MLEVCFQLGSRCLCHAANHHSGARPHRQLLRAIPPLLPPDLTCSPPSSPRADKNGSVSSSRQKRSRRESNGAGNDGVVGLGISVSGADDNAPTAK